MTEIWKDIEGYDGKYQVSNLGRVRSVDHIDKLNRHRKGKILKQYALPYGYLALILCNYPNIYVHRAVAKAFVPGYFEGAEVNHKDENKQNNRWDNLEWVTHAENCKYGSRSRICREKSLKNQGQPIEQYSIDGILIATYPSIRSAAKALKYSDRGIHRVLDTQYTAKGFRWRRKGSQCPPPTLIENKAPCLIENKARTFIENET